MATQHPQPTEIKLRRNSRVLELCFDDGAHFTLPCEFLRVYSPSAEVRGHSPGQEILLIGKESVNIKDIEPVGNYAIKLRFDDGHDTGLYSWGYLYKLGQEQVPLWQQYLDRLQQAGYQRRQPGIKGSSTD
ncbi:gamma-butyrobetaine hydroxylase-like domain-containing protein [Nitrosococcus wardiae]|nr:DUF971 domain-containing protein [Nitrosococcus wardiae]